MRTTLTLTVLGGREIRMLDFCDQKSMFSNLKVGCKSVYLVHANSTLCVCVCVCVFCLVRAVRKFHFSFVINLNTQQVVTSGK